MQNSYIPGVLLCSLIGFSSSIVGKIWLVSIGGVTLSLLIGLLLMIVYSVWSCTQGNEPNLPGISQAAKMQL